MHRFKWIIIKRKMNWHMIDPNSTFSTVIISYFLIPKLQIFKLELACFVLILHYRNPHCRINLPVQICFCIRLLKSNLVSLVYYLILLFEIMAFTRIRVTQFHNEKTEGDGKRWAFKGTPRRRDFVGGWLIRCNVFSLTKVA